MQELRILDHHNNDGYYRYEVQRRCRWYCLWLGWRYCNTFKQQDEAIAYLQQLEDLLGHLVGLGHHGIAGLLQDL